MTWGIIFWGYLTQSDNIFRLQKRIIRIIVGARTRDSCREFLKFFKVLPLTTQYTFSLVLFLVNNKSLFMEHSQLHKSKLGITPIFSNNHHI
jgi:hypothetical protein